LAERTLTIIKPDAVAAGHAGEILSRLEKAGFTVVAMRMRRLSRKEAEGFYHVHRERPFFASLTEFMSSGPCVPMVLEKENAIADFRALLGATDPAEADAGTIRRDFADNKGENICHGSDSVENGRIEAGYFFPEVEIVANS